MYMNPRQAKSGTAHAWQDWETYPTSNSKIATVLCTDWRQSRRNYVHVYVRAEIQTRGARLHSRP